MASSATNLAQHYSRTSDLALLVPAASILAQPAPTASGSAQRYPFQWSPVLVRFLAWLNRTHSSPWSLGFRWSPQSCNSTFPTRHDRDRDVHYSIRSEECWETASQLLIGWFCWSLIHRITLQPCYAVLFKLLLSFPHPPAPPRKGFIPMVTSEKPSEDVVWLAFW